MKLGEQEPERAAVLFGAAESLLDVLGAPLAPADQFIRDRDMKILKDQLDPQSLKTEWEKGYAMTQEGAIEHVMKYHS